MPTENGVELRWLFKVVRRWWWLVAAAGLVAGVGAYVASSRMSPVYRATATLLVDSARGNEGAEYSDIMASERLALTYSQMVTGRDVLQATMARLQLQETLDKFAKRVRADPVANTQLLRLSADDPDPARAAAIANTMANVFNEKVQAFELGQYTESLLSAQKRLDDVSKLLVRTQIDIDSASAQPVPDQAELARLDRLLIEYRSDYKLAQQDYESLRLTVAQSTDNVNLIEAAEAPVKPISPRIPLNTAIATVLGLVIGAGAALVVEYLNDTIRTPEDIGELPGLSIMGVIGPIADANKLVMVTDPRSACAEAYRVLATNIRFSSLDRPIHTLLVTSPHPREGKSTTTANLAVTMAETGLSVVVVDADLRRPVLHKLFGLRPRRGGLTSTLLDGNTPNQLQPSGVEGLQVLASGPLPANPTWITGSQKMQELLKQLTSVADLVLIDSAPALLLADTAVLARSTDGVLLVVRSGETRRQDLRRAVTALRQVGANPIGVVLCAVPTTRDIYYRYHEYTSTRLPNGPNRRVQKIEDWLDRQRRKKDEAGPDGAWRA